MSHLLWEVSELDATTRKADVSALKDFISKKVVTVRKSYGQHDTVKPALASLIGTVNDGTGFLSDDTGNRRFLTVMDYQKLDVNQIWAEAVAMYRQGEAWELTGPEKILQTQQNKQHESESILEGWIQSYFDISPSTAQSRMTASEIIDHLRTRYDIRMNGSGHAQAIELARALAHLGVKRYRTGTWRGYIGIAPK
jgi:predicted P-loop ATPase